ncbi:MAG: ribonuclease III [Deltaproteobacteria bacterium]|nr:ribonuclease III [Deltaproteobacteria bacterium]MBW2697420.1 ribonuclease III [Deltaproteobacteria bacterium]
MASTGHGHDTLPLETLEEQLGHAFTDRGLLETALQHSSYANETPGTTSNERLEFLGDAVIGLAVGHLLYASNPGWREGDLTRATAYLVDRPGLAALARSLELGRHLRLGRTERQSRGHEKDSILADAMEAVIGALFLDTGLEAVHAFAMRVFADRLRDVPVERDPKTRFQELVMARVGEFPRYNLITDSGVEGDGERFTVEARVAGEVWSQGVGRTKQAAEFAAAARALARLDEESAKSE